MYKFLKYFVSTGYKIQERHTFLSNTIGYLQEEQDALNKVKLILILSILYIFFASLLEIICFYYYNDKWHPFNSILVTGENIQLQNMTDTQSLNNITIDHHHHHCRKVLSYISSKIPTKLKNSYFPITLITFAILSFVLVVILCFVGLGSNIKTGKFLIKLLLFLS